MADPRRRQASREIWISKSHLVAALAASLGLAVSTFAVGYALGERSGIASAGSVTPAPAGPADQALVDMLARVDAAGLPNRGLGELTFPDALVGEDVGPENPAVQQTPEPITIEIASGDAGTPPPLENTAPGGRWTISLAAETTRTLADATLARWAGRGTLDEDALWIGQERVDGEWRYRVAFNGFSTRVGAEATLKELGSPAGATVVRY